MINLKNKTLADLCLEASKEFKDRLAFAMYGDGKIIRTLSYTQMGQKAAQIAQLLRQIGIEKGDRVLLLSENCPEWPCAYFGIALAGAVSVPLLTGFSEEQIQHIIEHSGAKAICTGNNSNSFNLPFIYIDNFIEPETAANFDFLEYNEDDLATIIYTSGTQGNSKGVMLSSANLIYSVLGSRIFLAIKPKDKMVSVLPLAHAYECDLGFLYPVMCGASITYLDKPPSPSVLLPALRLVRPTAMLTVPLFIEKIYRATIKPKLQASKLYKFPLTRNLVMRIAGKKLEKALGGRLRFFGIGGAPLSQEVESFLFHAKFPYSIGYGLTEAAPFIAGKAPFRSKVTAGLQNATGVSMRIQNDEIQTLGQNTMLGYYKDTEKTAETITSDGWLRTGDLGFLDEKGHVHIKGRLKALILGPSGENIYPEEIENMLGSSELIEESLVYAGNRGEIVALVRLTEAAKTALESTKLALDELRAWVNKKLSSFSRINRIVIKDDPFEKTPTMKIKRYLYI